MQLGKNLGLATITATLCMGAIATQTAQAAIVRYNFSFGANSGSFSFDNSTLTGSGLETIGTAENEGKLDVTFNYLGTLFTEEDDGGFDAFPIVTFANGQLQGLSYGVLDQFFIGSSVDTPDIGGNNFYVFDAPLSVRPVGTVSYSQVPEPLAIGGTAIATTMGLLIKRKKKASTIAD